MAAANRADVQRSKIRGVSDTLVIFFFICILVIKSIQFLSSVQWLSRVWLFVTSWTAARQAFLSITNSWSLLKLMFIESVMPFNHLILCHPLLLPPSNFPASGSFQVSQFFTSGGQSIGDSASTSILAMKIQDWYPYLELHYYNHWSHLELHINILSQAQSHI